MLAQDELTNLGWAARVPYVRLLHLFPDGIYNDRPMGFALERFLYDRFGFNYAPQLACFLAFHFANCGMAFSLFRRLGLRIPLAIAGIGVFGALCTTAQTATYLGASFDVLCTFFLLSSTLAILSERRALWLLSALMYLFALRSKEFGIVIPVYLTGLIAIRASKGLPLRTMLLHIGERLWLHYAILLAFGVRYLILARDMRAKIPAGASYYMDFSVMVPLKSFIYYTALVFGAERHYIGIVSALVLLILAYAVVRRRVMILFSLGVYALTLLPVSLLPNIRAPFYAYGPQVFLLLAMALFLQDVLDSLGLGISRRWWAGVCLALLVLTSATAFRKSDYFRDRIYFAWMVRSACGRSAAGVQKQLAGTGPSAHIYVNSRQESPWLFAYGDCVYPRMLRHSETIECMIAKPERELLTLYERDSSEKYFLDYAPDGTLELRFPAQAQPVADRPLQVAGAGWIDDQSPVLRYRGRWRPLRQFGRAYRGTVSYTDEAGAEVTLAFNGTSVSYLFTRAPSHGMAEVLLDGSRREAIDEFSSSIEWRSTVTYGSLMPGPHTITIRCMRTQSAESKAVASKGYDVDVDGFLVR